MRRWEWLTLWLFIIAAVVWLTILLTYGLYPVFVVKDGLLNACGLTFQRLYHNYLQLLAYLQVPWISHLHMSDFMSSANGAQHFRDVRHLFLLDIAVVVVTAFPALRTWQRLKQTQQRWRLVQPFWIGAVVPILLGGLMAINFDAVFIRFHQLLFRNNDWLFDPATDPIINVLPEDFFMACFVLALLLFEAVMAWGIWRGRVDARRR
ncbi:TIGR01906 family membrane protein [Lacticaseibacillus baoqingensis]|uniref:TIGR01906 family membrane protein n=1 Tax=Lacticaseibacillus baoqingensis TaxID=2486013 RepID=A0ABW4EAW9_9LACO|nr:TIGR01906 family membrane protein [Lacticaseibacillus baoqingensis]